MESTTATSTTETTATTPTVTVHNYVRAESDHQMRTYVEKFSCFGRLAHARAAYDVHHQVTVRAQRDTLYSFGVFDLTSPPTVTLPDPGERYQSLMVLSQEHSITVEHGPAEVTLTAEEVGTRYALLLVRTFVDPGDPDDLAAAHRLQDAVVVAQDDPGRLDLPDWPPEEVAAVRNTVMQVASTVADSTRCFGRKEELDPVYWLLGAALGWGGLPATEAIYENVVPERNDGVTPHTLTVGDVPVDGFWSVTLYDGEGWMPVNDRDAYSFNNLTARRDDDGTVTIHFGGDPAQPNHLPIVPGWNYVVRLYRPREEVRSGGWRFPPPVPVDADAEAL
ncbi:DUF1214 domain-containing protein [Nocardioides sp. YIM 152588]|uniref:DUF1214 domain-containing protein n=1 Tax=Nocardioides sp. YIM 152588 TaxID=3158259 RepID=UPI0032E4A025